GRSDRRPERHKSPRIANWAVGPRRMAMAETSTSPNPRRVEAGRRNRRKRNRRKRKGLTPEGLAPLRAAAPVNGPWRHAPGPRTAAGKARAAPNGEGRQKGPISACQLRAELAEVRPLIGRMQAGRARLTVGGGEAPQEQACNIGGIGTAEP